MTREERAAARLEHAQCGCDSLLDALDEAEAALDRVRAMCDETDRNAVVVEHAGDVDVIITRAGLLREVNTAAVRAAIAGSS